MLPEDKLIELCKKGKQQAQEELYDRFSSAMLATCMRYTGNRAEAEDLLQEGFIKIFKNIYDFRYKNQGSLAAWIKRIMVNTSISYLRKKKQLMFIENIESYNSFENDEEIIDENDSNYPDSEQLMKLISELPEGYRLVFNMYVFEDYGHKEIAQMLGITEGTSKSQLSKARLYLQKQLNNMKESKKKLLLAV